MAYLRTHGIEPSATLGQAFKMWVDANKAIKSPAHVGNVARLERLHLGQLRDTPLADITTAAVEDELNRFLAKGSEPSFGDLWIKYIRLVCKWAVNRKMLDFMPFHAPKIKTKQQQRPLLPSDKTNAWLENVDFLSHKNPAIALILRLQLGLGLRGGEARRARWEWLDAERKTYTPGDTKGGKAWPRPVPDWLLSHLSPRGRTEGLIAPNRWGKPFSYTTVQKVFIEACRAVGLPKMTMHRLRATYATWLSEHGVPVQDIQLALEHKDIQTTARYLSPSIERIARGQSDIAQKIGIRG
jgi:integrase